MAQQSKLFVRNGVKKICVVCLVGASLPKVLQRTVFLSGMNALNVKLVKAHWHECSIETMPTYILYMQTFSITKDLPKALFCKSPCWRSKSPHALSSSPKLASNWREESGDCVSFRCRACICSRYSRACCHPEDDTRAFQVMTLLGTVR